MTTEVRFHNRTAVFVWGFTVVWLAMLLAMSYVFQRDGAPDGYSNSIVLAVFLVLWVCGLGLALFAASKSCLSVTVKSPDQILATWLYPHKVVRQVISKDQLSPAEVVNSRDSDGDPYYIARTRTIDGKAIDIAEGHNRVDCEQACERFNELLFRVRVGG